MESAIKMHQGFEDHEDHSRRICDHGQWWPLKRILSGKRVAAATLILWDEVGSEASGLQTNIQKSNIIPISCAEDSLTTIQDILPCTILEFPCKYLGLPLSNKKLRKRDLMPWIEKIADKLPCWKAALMIGQDVPP
jgi:hypothetical protein